MFYLSKLASRAKLRGIYRLKLASGVHTMTLQVTNTHIQVKNSSGVVKFDSDDKLIHKKFTQTGSSISMGSGTNPDSYEFTLNTTLNPKDFGTVSITVSAADGNVLDDVVGSKVQLNFPLMANFGIRLQTQR